MPNDEKSLWNKKYSEGSHLSLDPDPLLVSAYDEFLSNHEPGLALDVAGGVGRHAIWLAQRGWRVRLMEISDVGIELAKKNTERAFSGRDKEELITTATADLSAARDLGREQYDLVLVFYYLQRELFPALMAALKPGGFLIYKTYTTEQKRFGGGPNHPMFLLEPNELLRAFNALRILRYHETTAEKGVAELVARR